MDIIIKILQYVLAPIISGIATFLVTKYTYKRNVPLDEMRIAYNRVYYPIYKLIYNEEADIEIIIYKSKYYLQKYNKHIDKSTQKAFRILCKSNTIKKKNTALKNFENNIYNRSSYLRRRLGYLEPSFLLMYTYSSKSEKSTIRIFLEILFLYITIIIGGFSRGKVQEISIEMFVIFIAVIILELICKFTKFIYYKFSK